MKWILYLYLAWTAFAWPWPWNHEPSVYRPPVRYGIEKQTVSEAQR